MTCSVRVQDDTDSFGSSSTLTQARRRRKGRELVHRTSSVDSADTSHGVEMTTMGGGD